MRVGSTKSLSRPITVLVEGNIGAGKSLFLNKFLGIPGFQVMQEPVDKWRNLNGHNLLQLMYEDPARWSMAFQTYVQLTMLKQHLACDAPVKIMERSIHSARYCFINNLKNSGKMQSSELEVLDSWFQFLSTQFDLGVDFIVYLKTHPEIAYERLKLRNRGEENLISLNYLKDLHEMHEKWLTEESGHPLPAPVLTVDANKPAHLMQADFDHVKMRIDQILKRKSERNPDDDLRTFNR
eukprot:TRINITY_DN8583_c0_g1_i1.p1 TRINITY_DN8583_c0_g1~~TRINITY_DN8583_c0_g1_i1.p1  ORF type:complete len:238 (+),score=40.26 TRINITY_DN8583_c0_g1_i1:41-754(+)